MAFCFDLFVRISGFGVGCCFLFCGLSFVLLVLGLFVLFVVLVLGFDA